MRLNRALLLPSCWWVLDLIMQLAGDAENTARVTRVTACKRWLWDYSRSAEAPIEEKLGAHCVGSWGTAAGSFDKFGPFAELSSQKEHISAPVTSLMQSAADTWSWRNILSQNKSQAGPAAYMEWKIPSWILMTDFEVQKHLLRHEVHLLFTWNQCYPAEHGGTGTACNTSCSTERKYNTASV